MLIGLGLVIIKPEQITQAEGWIKMIGLGQSGPSLEVGGGTHPHKPFGCHSWGGEEWMPQCPLQVSRIHHWILPL